MNEKQLIRGCLEGNRKAQKALYDKYFRRMMSICLRYAGEMEDARDLLQEGFIKVYTNIHKYAGSGSFEGWMRKIFVNCALEHLRNYDVLRNACDIDDVEYQLVSDESAISQTRSEELMAYVRSLPKGFRLVFNLFAIEGYSHKEIGHILNISESTSRSQYMRARRMLQEMILKH